MTERMERPSLDLADIKRAVRDRKLRWLPSVQDSLPDKVRRLPKELEGFIERFTVDDNFYFSEVSTSLGHIGECFDTYVWQTEPKRGILFKFAMDSDDSVRVFSCHNTKIRSFLETQKKRRVQ